MAAASDRASARDPEEACRRWMLIVVCVSTALLLLNVSAPNVALSDIEKGIGASFSDLEWVLSGYALCLAVFQLTAGSLADRFGRRRLFLIGLGAFTLASLACTLAPSPPALIAAVVDRARDGDLEGALRAAPASARDGVQHAFGVAFSSGLNETLAIAAGLGLVGALAGAVLVRSRDFISVRAPEPEPVIAEAA